jgi:hypothetical protein
MWSTFQGFRVGPFTIGAVLALKPSSGVAVRPMVVRPARLKRVISVES